MTPAGTAIAPLAPSLVRQAFPEPRLVPVSTWETTDGRPLHAASDGDTRYLWSPGAAHFRFTADGDVDWDGALPEHEASALWTRSALPLAVQARGTQVLHASAVCGPAGVVALCGVSAAGKSTLCAATAHGEVRAVADDALPFRLRDGEATALTLPFALRPRSSAATPDLPGAAASGEGGETLPLAAVVLLDPGGAEPTLERLRPPEAVGALMRHAYCFALEEGKAELVVEYAELARCVPVFGLRYERRPETLSRTSELVRGLAGV